MMWRVRSVNRKVCVFNLRPTTIRSKSNFDGFESSFYSLCQTFFIVYRPSFFLKYKTNHLYYVLFSPKPRRIRVPIVYILQNTHTIKPKIQYHNLVFGVFKQIIFYATQSVLTFSTIYMQIYEPTR